MKKLSFDSTPTLKGIVFQFLVALDRCFEMQEGESVYIETFGDVSVLGGDNPTQIESKCYKTDLTDLDENVWNTIHNWMRDNFPIEKFSSLFLLTTQKAGKKSEWGGWNKKGLEDKLETLNRIKERFDKKKRKSEKLTSMMDAIFDASKSKRLAEIAKKLFIDCLDTNDEQFYKSLLNRDKSIPNIQKEKYINSLLGWIIKPQKSWTISNEAFEKEAQEIAAKLRENTAVFPDKLQLTNIKHEEYEENAFVRKIKNIEYDEVIPEAVDDYVHTALLIEQELGESLAIKTQFEEYEESVEKRYRTEYRKASRINEIKELLKRSQDLYDNVTLANDGTFHTYNSVPSYFHNGVVQILADEKDDIVWLLKGHKPQIRN